MECEELRNLEHAEDLVISLLENAGNAIGELKEIQANDTDKNSALIQYIAAYFDNLTEIKEILISEVNSLASSSTLPLRRPGIDELAISEWQAKIVADNLHEIAN
ncbi:hypothetical protein GPJ56_003026 [Histomonas meleagridis]|uniref:uncharacterized protein n=1 Tax=Histomonas meleagridis TaxID=135588 RepID=UPI00355987CF|nr:hypothetical protein GPJ56_003026 [Histomonas meleagridis]KAH0796682.1 hypothetical protein GO595_010575 [Histomonas meleagridis]